MVRRGAAAAADDVDEAGLGELADQPRHVFRALVILAELVGQAGVRIGADQRIGDAADVGDMGAQIFGAERAVEADGDGLGVPHRIPERFRQLSRQQPAGLVGDGAGDHHGHVDAARFGDFGDGVERRLGVQRIENGLDQQQVGAAVEQAVDLLAIGLAQIVEGDGAVAGVGNVGRDRGGPVGRAQRAGDEARLAVLGRDAFGGVAGKPWRHRGSARRRGPTCRSRPARSRSRRRCWWRRCRRRRADSRRGCPRSPCGCVRIRRSLLPRTSRWKSAKRAPRNAASSYCRPWIMVPIAPSSTRMRSRAAASRAVRFGRNRRGHRSGGFLCAIGTNAQQMADREHEVRAVHGVEMEVSRRRAWRACAPGRPRRWRPPACASRHRRRGLRTCPRASPAPSCRRVSRSFAPA